MVECLSVVICIDVKYIYWLRGRRQEPFWLGIFSFSILFIGTAFVSTNVRMEKKHLIYYHFYSNDISQLVAEFSCDSARQWMVDLVWLRYKPVKLACDPVYCVIKGLLYTNPFLRIICFVHALRATGSETAKPQVLRSVWWSNFFSSYTFFFITTAKGITLAVIYI